MFKKWSTILFFSFAFALVSCDKIKISFCGFSTEKNLNETTSEKLEK